MTRSIATYHDVSGVRCDVFSTSVQFVCTSGGRQAAESETEIKSEREAEEGEVEAEEESGTGTVQ